VFTHTSEVSVDGVNGDVFDPVDLDGVDNFTLGNHEEVVAVVIVVIFGVVSNAFAFPIAHHSSHLIISNHEAIGIVLSDPAFVELFRADGELTFSEYADLSTDISPAVILLQVESRDHALIEKIEKCFSIRIVKGF
jgi:hypothetical protein